MHEWIPQAVKTASSCDLGHEVQTTICNLIQLYLILQSSPLWKSESLWWLLPSRNTLLISFRLYRSRKVFLTIIKQLLKHYHYKSCPDFSLGIIYKSLRFAVLALQVGYERHVSHVLNSEIIVKAAYEWLHPVPPSFPSSHFKYVSEQPVHS